MRGGRASWPSIDTRIVIIALMGRRGVGVLMMETLQVVDESVQRVPPFTVCTDVVHDNLVVELVATTDTSKVIPIGREERKKE